MDQFRSGTKVLVQRGQMGGRKVYTAMLGLQEQNSLVPPRPESGGLDNREQRLTDPAHAADIASYVAEVDDYYLPGLMVLLHDNVEDSFEPLTDKDGNVITDRIGWLWMDARVGKSLGDGMHRGMGIEPALAANPARADDTIVISFIVEPDRDKRRQLFNDINRTQKRVAKSLGVSYDQRDPISIAVNETIDSNPFGDLVERERPTAGRTSGKLTTSGTLYDAVAMVTYGWSGKPGRRTGQATREEALNSASLLMDAFTALPDIQEVLDASNPGEEANRLRSRSILGSGATLKALAGALFVAKGRLGGVDQLRKALGNLEQIDWDPKAWVSVGFVPEGGKTPHSRTQEVRAAGLRIADYLAPVEEV